MKRLNMGCGSDIRIGWTNLDCVALPGIDIVHDLNSVPLPFEDESFDLVECQNVLEHLDYIRLLREIHRILVPGGKVAIQVPHFTSRNNYDDPTHIHRFSLTTFEFFVRGLRRDYYFDFHFASFEGRRLHFEKQMFLMYNHVVEWLFPLLPAPRFLYEGTFLCRLLPAESLNISLVK